MAISTTPAGGNLTVTITYTAPTAKMSAVLTDATRFIWVDVVDAEGRVILTYANASNAQRLAQLDAYVKKTLLDIAKAYNLQADIEAARLASQAENAANYDLGAG